MMKVLSVDFEVWREVFSRLRSETDTANGVLRGLFNLPALNQVRQVGRSPSTDGIKPLKPARWRAEEILERVPEIEEEEVAEIEEEVPPPAPVKAPAPKPARRVGKVPGWRGAGIELPEGTELRMVYKNQEYLAMIVDGRIYTENGSYDSMTTAAGGAVGLGMHLNGWRYWDVKLPGSEEFIKAESLRPTKPIRRRRRIK